MKKVLVALLSLVLVLSMMTGAIAEAVETAATEAAAAEIEATVIALGETMNLVVEEAQAENATTAWATSDETVVTVDANGAATAVNAGEAVITAVVTTTVVETVEKTVTETVEETNAETGETTTKEVEKTVSEEVEKTETKEITINVVVEAAVCPGCAAEYTSAEEFTAHVQIAACGTEGHYVCDGQDHETQLDEFCRNENPHRVCLAGVATHDCETCGKTYACEDSGSHATCIACGKSWCDKTEGDHFTPKCGKIEHRPCMLDGKFNTSEHRRCRHCNALRCNGARHGKGKCVKASTSETYQPEE